MANVIALAGWPAEVLAYALAMYSRSANSIQDSIVRITQEQSAGFLEKFYFQYGHASIADNAHVPIAFERISQIAAYELEDEQLWDGQEQSTRDQDFNRENPFFVPTAVRNTPQESEYIKTADFNLARYRETSNACLNWLRSNHTKPTDMKKDAHERTLRARAFDVARYWLFGGIFTSVGQYVSVRTLESQISRLMSSEYPEIVELGQSMRDACSTEPLCPANKNEPPVAPTLVKYTAPNQFRIKLRQLLRAQAKKWLLWQSDGKTSRYVKLLPSALLANCFTPLNEIVATLLYEASAYPYGEIIAFVAGIHESEKIKLIENVLELRNEHDQLPKAFAMGQKFQFDICMDRGGERDLHRHRNCIQIHQPLTTDRGWDTPDLIRQLGIERQYHRDMSSQKYFIDSLRKEIGVDADYLMPFAFRSGTLYKMDLRQAVYMSELRSGSQGHFSYREVACQMHDQLIQKLPFLRDKLRVTPFEQEDIFKH